MGVEVLRFEAYDSHSQVSGPSDRWAVVLVTERNPGKVTGCVLDSNTFEQGEERTFIIDFWYRVSTVL